MIGLQVQRLDLQIAGDGSLATTIWPLSPNFVVFVVVARLHEQFIAVVPRVAQRVVELGAEATRLTLSACVERQMAV